MSFFKGSKMLNFLKTKTTCSVSCKKKKKDINISTEIADVEKSTKVEREKLRSKQRCQLTN